MEALLQSFEIYTRKLSAGRLGKHKPRSSNKNENENEFLLRGDIYICHRFLMFPSNSCKKLIFT